MISLPPIPTPPALRWREFRIKVLPPVVFAAVLTIAALLWVQHVTPPMVVGQVEATQAHVSSTKPGRLTQLQVDRFKTVRADEPVAIVIITDPRVLESSLALIRAEVEMLRVSMTPVFDREQSEIRRERFRLEWLNQRVLLASAKVNLHYAEAEFARVSELYQTQTNVVSRAAYEVALRDRDALRAEVEEGTRAVAELEAAVQRLRLSQPNPSEAGGEAALRAAIAVQEERLRLAESELRPVTLTAPISGVVSMVYRRAGENIVAGEPILTITSSQPERIVAYVRHPMRFEPQVGMRLEVRSRSLDRAAGIGLVQQVAPNVQPIPAAMVLPFSPTGVELGLPFEVSIPAGSRLRGGELVDLRFLSP
jgi:multidrug resistance efflux pump